MFRLAVLLACALTCCAESTTSDSNLSSDIEKPEQKDEATPDMQKAVDALQGAQVKAWKGAQKAAVGFSQGLLEQMQKNAAIVDNPWMKGVAAAAKMGNLLQQGMKKAIQDDATDPMSIGKAMNSVMNPEHPQCKGIAQATKEEWKKPVSTFAKPFCKFGRLLSVMEDPIEKCFDGDHDAYARQKKAVTEFSGAGKLEHEYCKQNGFCFMKKEKANAICKSLFPTHTGMTFTQIMQAKQGIYARIKGGNVTQVVLDAAQPYVPNQKDADQKYKLAKATAQASATFTKTDASKLAEAQCALGSLACDIHYCQEAYCDDE